MKVFRNWNTFEEEKKLPFHCDQVVADSNDIFYRAISINATAEIIFKWLCQMRVAPYSYDLIDNFGRRSPRNLTPGLTNLGTGQMFMFIFELAHFVENKEVTIAVGGKSLINRLFGSCAITYLIHAGECEDESRLIVKFALKYPASVIGWFIRKFLPLGDLIMVRKQLLTFKKLAEDMQEKEQTERRKNG